MNDIYIDRLNRQLNRKKMQTAQLQKACKVMLLIMAIQLVIIFVLAGILIFQEPKIEYIETPVTEESGKIVSPTVLTSSPTLPAVSMTPTEAPTEPPVVKKSLGSYTVTAYCGCSECCGSWADTREGDIVVGAQGTELIDGYSCASPFPFGTILEIEGYGEVKVQDRTAGWIVEKYDSKIIDIYFATHEQAEAFGKRTMEVYMDEGQ